MGIFARICPNLGKETEEYLEDVIRYEGDNDTVVWKYPEENFKFGTYLIVHESQEALFLQDGRDSDLFGPGRYLLEIEEIPAPELYGAVSREIEGTFHSEVYFINHVHHLNVRWGTPEKVRFMDPMTFTPLEIGASGEMIVTVTDSRKLVKRIVGTTAGVTWSEEKGEFASLQLLFRTMIANAVKINLPAIIRAEQIDILEIDEKLGLISDVLKEKISQEFAEYGLEVQRLYIKHVIFPEDDPNFQRIRQLHTVALQTRMFQADATIKSAKAQNETVYRTAEEQSRALIEAARREAEVQSQITQNELARYEAERKIMEAKAEAEVRKLRGDVFVDTPM